ncbi:alpha beta-hydrolase isoform A [Chlorella sorokiniana]|uniref:Alpha beta-hydrolase isoform A n=1 Tax=Chlorella sorokiniana TaxID=3076 RepID=A0A2P6TCB2_CHLSO|nr:alpha beta-hydrolase isoform A [Chlorella sorokiniana]|eukprot:PRW20266.1 alpha beta-hydrolase isoform A [Chlorella sorokiniana]
MQAYNALEVEEGSPCLKMTSGGGTEVTFVSEEFLRRKFAGLVEVTVQSASGLPAADWWPSSKSDPYAVVNIGDSAAATSVVNQELNPRWGESFYLFVSDPASQRLTVRVLDADVGKADDLLGTTMRGLKDLVDGEPCDMELPLRGPKGEAGTISLRLRFLPFGEDGSLAEEATRQRMGGPVTGSPPATIMSSPWRALQKSVLSAAADAMFDPVAFIENHESDTQAWLFWNPGTRSLCIAFRGTEQAKWKDILTDLLLVPASLDPEGLAERPWVPRSNQAAEGGPPNLEAAVAALQSKRLELRAAVADGLRSVFQQQQQRQQQRAERPQAGAAGGATGGEDDQPAEEAVWVHNGFLDAYSSVRSEVMRLLETALAGEEEPWTLYITGHSLGGALATLCTFDCARRVWRRGAVRPAIVHYNYGSPRVGNKAFADAFDQLVPNTWRVANTNDAVASVPRMLGYCHVGHKAELSGEGQLELTRNSSRTLGEGAEMADVALAAVVNLPALTEQLLAAEGGGQGDSAAQAAKPALLSAAAALASAASALAGAGKEQAAGAAAALAEEAGSAAAAAAAADVPSAKDVQALLEEEINAMNRLLDGSALNEHLEPLYLENLQRAIERLRQANGGSGSGN